MTTESPQEMLAASDSFSVTMPCRFCPATAIAVYSLPEGCLCAPDDREQALCATHILRASPRGGMELVRVLHAAAWGELQRFMARDGLPRSKPTEEDR